jgi:hypothetical protein
VNKFLIFTALIAVPLSNALAMGKAKASATTTPAPVKKVLEFNALSDASIDLPPTGLNGAAFTSQSYDFGPNLLGALRIQMEGTSKYLVQIPSVASPMTAQAVSPEVITGSGGCPDDFCWDGSALAPAATFTIKVNALVFRSGNRGDSMYYGFDERFRTPFNDGSGKLHDEFPLTLVEFEPNHFDATFNDRGSAPFDTQSGLDLGEGFNFDYLVAWISAKWASYHSEIRMQVEMDAPLAGRHEVKEIAVTGHGYFFDIVGGYAQYSGGIGLDRNAAMSSAFTNAFNGTTSIINNWTQSLPLTALVFDVKPAGQILLNVGLNANVPVGTQYEIPDGSGTVVEVVESLQSGAVAKFVSGNFANIVPNVVLRQVLASNPVVAHAATSGPFTAQAVASAEAVSVAPEAVALPSTNLPKTTFPTELHLQLSGWQAFLDSLIGLPLLPYRIWRYFQYDQSYHGNSQGDYVQTDTGYNDDSTPQDTSNQAEAKKDSALSEGTTSAGALAWAQSQQAEAWAKQIGLDQIDLTQQPEDAPVVAVIDSGIDYNSSVFQDSIWVNPSPFTDPLGHTDNFGWDFISGDSRPYDDMYHGSEVSSALLSVAPNALIMPLKVFNPWGVTSSAALYGAFHYAVDHGAQIILCAWATRLQTQTMQMGIQYAHDHGVLVVTAAGDGGYNLSQGVGSATYPAILSKSFDNILTVAGVDTSDALVQVSAEYSNFDPQTVQIAAPGESIRVADPRGGTNHVTNTGVAAGLVAGQVARNIGRNGNAQMGTYQDWIKEVLSQADAVPGLTGAVQGGLRLHIR